MLCYDIEDAHVNLESVVIGPNAAQLLISHPKG